MKARNIIEEGSFRSDLERLVPDDKWADVILEAAWNWFPLYADDGRQVPGTDFLEKTVPDWVNGRNLSIHYRIDGDSVRLYAILEYSLFG